MLLLLIARSQLGVKANGKVIYVTVGKTIQSVINNASTGDTIIIPEGIYFEHLVVNKSLSIIGENRDFTIVDGNGTGSVITVTASNVTIQSLTINGSGMDANDGGVFLDQSAGDDISQNNLLSNANGIVLSLSSNNVVANNIIRSNTNDGMLGYFMSYDIISSNIISSNANGIEFYSCVNNNVFNNTLSNEVGILSYSSYSNTISVNTFSNNDVGMSLINSNNNTIYHNNFKNNLQHVYLDHLSYSNRWDNGAEGNYWDNHTGVDSHNDGIGDTPFRIFSNVTDNYPLVGFFSDFKIMLQQKEYDVSIISNSTISNFSFEIGTETGNRIIRFDVAGKDGIVGFSRVEIPNELMGYPYIVVIGNEEVIPTLLPVSNETDSFLYMKYPYENQTVTIIYSDMMHLYGALQTNFLSLNTSYYGLLNNYLALQTVLSSLNASNNALIGNYTNLLYVYSQLHTDYDVLSGLNSSYQSVLKDYTLLLGNYSQLQQNLTTMSGSYQQHLAADSEQRQNVQSLIYILATTTAMFMIITVYLSKRARFVSTNESNSK
jgi:parallel beta-helix repeat protein